MMKRLKRSAIAVGITIALFSGATYANGDKPTAFFGASPMSGNAPLDVTLDASASHDPDGSITSYSWADSRGNTTSGATTSLNFTEDGLYSVILTVTDNDGNTDTALRTISVGLDACQGHATYSGEDGMLYIPYVDMPTIPMIGGNHTPSNNQRAVIEATLQLINASNLFEIEDIKLRSPSVITGESNECHAVYSLDGKLHIPYVDLPLLTILNGIPIPFGVETYQATMQLIPFSDLFLIGSVTPVGTELPDPDPDSDPDPDPIPDPVSCGDDLTLQAQLMEPYVLYESINDMLVVEYAISGEWPNNDLNQVITPPTGVYTEGFTLNGPSLYVEATMKSEAEGVSACFAGKAVRFFYHPNLSNWTCSTDFANGVPSENMTFFPMTCD